MRRLTAYLFSISFTLGGCATTEESLQEQGLKHMDASQTTELVAGNTTVGRTAEGKSFTVLFRADGTAAGTKGSSSDTGTWEVSEEGYLCNQWTTWWNGDRKCHKSYLIGNEVKYYDLQGNFGGFFKVTQGNPNDL